MVQGQSHIGIIIRLLKNGRISFPVISPTCLVLFCYPPEQGKPLGTKTCHSSSPSARLGSGGCDVTGSVPKSKCYEHNVDFSCQK